MISYGIPEKFLNIIQSMYEKANCIDVHRGLLRREFTIAFGVKQGYIFSPLSFLFFLYWIIVKVNNALLETIGVHLQMTQLEDLLVFADDICLMSNSRQEMADKLDRVVNYGR